MSAPAPAGSSTDPLRGYSVEQLSRVIYIGYPIVINIQSVGNKAFALEMDEAGTNLPREWGTPRYLQFNADGTHTVVLGQVFVPMLRPAGQSEGDFVDLLKKGSSKPVHTRRITYKLAELLGPVSGGKLSVLIQAHFTDTPRRLKAKRPEPEFSAFTWPLYYLDQVFHSVTATGDLRWHDAQSLNYDHNSDLWGQALHRKDFRYVDQAVPLVLPRDTPIRTRAAFRPQIEVADRHTVPVAPGAAGAVVVARDPAWIWTRQYLEGLVSRRDRLHQSLEMQTVTGAEFDLAISLAEGIYQLVKLSEASKVLHDDYVERRTVAELRGRAVSQAVIDGEIRDLRQRHKREEAEHAKLTELALDMIVLCEKNSPIYSSATSSSYVDTTLHRVNQVARGYVLELERYLGDTTNVQKVRNFLQATRIPPEFRFAVMPGHAMIVSDILSDMSTIDYECALRLARSAIATSGRTVLAELTLESYAGKALLGHLRAAVEKDIARVITDYVRNPIDHGTLSVLKTLAGEPLQKDLRTSGGTIDVKSSVGAILANKDKYTKALRLDKDQAAQFERALQRVPEESVAGKGDARAELRKLVDGQLKSLNQVAGIVKMVLGVCDIFLFAATFEKFAINPTDDEAGRFLKAMPKMASDGGKAFGFAGEVLFKGLARVTPNQLALTFVGISTFAGKLAAKSSRLGAILTVYEGAYNLGDGLASWDVRLVVAGSLDIAAGVAAYVGSPLWGYVASPMFSLCASFVKTEGWKSKVRQALESLCKGFQEARTSWDNASICDELGARQKLGELLAQLERVSIPEKLYFAEGSTDDLRIKAVLQKLGLESRADVLMEELPRLAMGR